MKMLLMSVFMLSSVSVYAQKEEKFEEHKQMILAEMDKRISLLQDERSCMASASDHNGMKACREKSKANHEKMREEHQQRKMQEIDQKMKHLEEEKKKMMNKKSK